MLFFGYFALLLLITVYVSRQKINLSVKQIFLMAFLVRIATIFLFPASKSNDLAFFVNFGQDLVHKNPSYAADYFPFIGYLGMFADSLKSVFSPFITLKMLFSVFDALIIYPLYYLSKKDIKTIVVYAFNPITITIVAIHGQMDSIPAFFLLLSVLFFIQKKESWSIFTLAIGVFTKTWPILFIFSFFKRSRKKLLYCFIGIIPLLLVFLHSYIFNVSFTDIVQAVKDYRGVFGEWGISKLLAFASNHSIHPDIQQLIRRIFLIAFFIFVLMRKEGSIIRSIFMSMLFLFSFTPTFGIQWLSWLIPYLLIVHPRYWLLMLVLLSIYVTFGFAWDADPYFKSHMTQWNSVISRVGLLSWPMIVFMFFQNIKTPKSR